jgi:hypothetical protein
MKDTAMTTAMTTAKTAALSWDFIQTETIGDKNCEEMSN